MDWKKKIQWLDIFATWTFFNEELEEEEEEEANI
jgi:hypothetical protein